MYFTGMQTIFHATIKNRFQIFKSKIDTIRSTIRMLGTNTVEC
jgi:hypothetical protein